jgi:membrane protease YdiL (CAAX protease family)
MGMIRRYIAIVIVAEALGGLTNSMPGVFLHALLLPVLLLHYVVEGDREQDDREWSGQKQRRLAALPVLALVPLMRILSFAMLIEAESSELGYLLTGIPLMTGIILAARLTRLGTRGIGLRLGLWRRQTLIALAGVPLGLIAFLVLRPNPTISPSGSAIAVASFIMLLGFGSFVEELLFRGAIQEALFNALGAPGIFWSWALFASSYSGWHSPEYVIVFGLIGVVFSLGRAWTDSILGVSMAHSLVTIGCMYLWPRIIL